MMCSVFTAVGMGFVWCSEWCSEQDSSKTFANLCMAIYQFQIALTSLWTLKDESPVPSIIGQNLKKQKNGELPAKNRRVVFDLEEPSRE